MSDEGETPHEPTPSPALRMPGRKWRWDDGKFYPDPPPLGREWNGPPRLTPEEARTVLVAAAVVAEEPKAAPIVPRADRPEVPADFTPTPRYWLRTAALDFALRAAQIMHGRVAHGAEILQEAEDIERWLVQPTLSPPLKEPANVDQSSTISSRDGETTERETLRPESSSSTSNGGDHGAS